MLTTPEQRKALEERRWSSVDSAHLWSADEYWIKIGSASVVALRKSGEHSCQGTPEEILEFTSIAGLGAPSLLVEREALQERLAGLRSFLGVLHKEMELSLDMVQVDKGTAAAGLIERWMVLIDATGTGEGGKPDGL